MVCRSSAGAVQELCRSYGSWSGLTPLLCSAELLDVGDAERASGPRWSEPSHTQLWCGHVERGRRRCHGEEQQRARRRHWASPRSRGFQKVMPRSIYIHV